MSNFRQMLENRRNREALYNTASYWESKADDYQGDAISMWRNATLNELYSKEQFSLLNAWLPDVKDLRILDVGCGTGRLSRYFAGRGAIVRGFDFAEKVVDVARRQTPGDNPSFAVMSLFDLDEDNRYDVAISWGVVTVACRTREELRDVMYRLGRAVVPGGRVIILEPIHKGFLHRVLALDVDEFKDVMEQANLRVRSVRSLHFWPTRLLLCFIDWPRWITRSVYGVGQSIMGLCQNRKFGDYTAINAEVQK